MTPETQALTRYALNWTQGVTGIKSLSMPIDPEGSWVRYEDAAAALSSLSCDLETAKKRITLLERVGETLGRQYEDRTAEVYKLRADLAAARQELAKYQNDNRRINRGLSSGESK